MAGRLPGDLVDEAKSTLDSVGRIKLPPHVWQSVRRHLASVDSAVGADDPAALRIALDELHRMGVNPWRLPPPSRSSSAPTESSAPEAPSREPTMAHGRPAQPPPPGWLPPSGSTPEFGRVPPPRSPTYPGAPATKMGQRGRTSRSRRIVAMTVGVGILFAGAVFVAVALISTARQVSPPQQQTATSPPATLSPAPGTSDSPADIYPTFTGTPTFSPAPSDTLTPSETPFTPGPTPPTTGAPPPGSGGSGIAPWIPAGGLFALAGIVVIAVVVVLRRRSRSAPSPAHVEVVADRDTGPPAALPAPKEVVEFANRTVMQLVEYGGTS